MNSTEIYENPLCTRYASRQMQEIFSDDARFKLWRKLWIALAESEKELGLNITQEQIDELKAHAEDLNYDIAKAREKEVRHDVMAQVYAYGVQAPKAAPIIHLGATSCYVTDNAELITIHKALECIQDKLVNIIVKLRDFSKKYKDTATLGYTHLQPAQLTTVGKRATLWAYDLVLDLQDLTSILDGYKLRGVKGTTGTQASFLTLFDGNHEKVKKLNELVVKKMGFKNVFAVSGQTYTRKFDYKVMACLSSIAQSAYKFANDMRILQSFKEMEEPFESKQIGSSAMAYKRNPMRSERLCSLARFVITLPMNESITSSTQWFERTLDDSANKRISIAQGFLALDAVLSLYLNICDGLVVNEKVIASRVNEELPFMATEEILMECVKAGGDRQKLHERIRVHSMESAKVVKQEGKPNDLIERIKKDSEFSAVHDKLDSILCAKNFIGRASNQVDDFISEVINPELKKHKINEVNVKIEV